MIPRLHVVTDDRVLARADFAAGALEALEAGGGRIALHVRGPRTSGRTLYRAAAGLVRPAARTGAWLVVNDRVDVALALGISRVHLGGRSMPAGVARRLLGPDARVGRSVHSAAGAGGDHGRIDYLFAGAVFATPSHAGMAPGGLGVVRTVAAASSAPVVGIGGITAGRAAQVLSAGARGVAVIRAVWDAPSPGYGVRCFLDSWPEE
ncbi:MAG: thiamine phosphate synthase [Gammaproteobacteria bacterium]|nr:thiamine phosphate synthase [Gammaproteobacteria bacterium]